MPVKIDYTQHAVARMAKRQLQPAWVERVVASPDLVEDDDVDSELEHRLGKVPELANRVLRVILLLSLIQCVWLRCIWTGE